MEPRCRTAQKIWVRSTGPSQSRCSRPPRRRPSPPATSTSTTANAGTTDAQKLILAKTATLKTTVQATAEFLPPGSLVVTKTIAGPAAGSQGRVVIHTVCDGTALTPDFVIAAGTPAGDQVEDLRGHPGRIGVHRHRDIRRQHGWHGRGRDRGRAGGDDPLRRKRDGRTSPIPMTSSARCSSRRRSPVRVPDSKGRSRIHTVCDGKALTPDFVIPAGTPAGDQTKQYDQIRRSGDVHGHGDR